MCLLGCDIGSSSVKASIVDKDTGLTLASDFYPKEEAAIKAVRPGWAEQNPDDWWMYLKEAIKGAIAKAGIKGTEIDAIGISYPGRNPAPGPGKQRQRAGGSAQLPDVRRR